MNAKLKKVLQYCFFLGLGIFLTYWQYSKMTVAQKDFFVKSVKNSNYFFLIPIIILALISHISRAYRWRYLINPMGYHPKLNNTFATVMIGYLINSFLPRIGEIAKCTFLGKREKIPIDKLIGTILIERAIDLLCYVLVILITIILQYNRIKELLLEIYKKSIEQGGMNPFLKIGIILIVIIIVFFIVKKIATVYKNNIFFQKLNGVLSGVKDGFKSINNLEKKRMFWLHTLIIWACYLLQIYVGFKAMEFTSALGIDAAFAVLALGTLAMIVTPGGMGAFPLAVMEVLLLFNVAMEAATAFGWVIWGVSTSIIIVTGLICLIWFLSNAKSKDRNYANQ